MFGSPWMLLGLGAALFIALAHRLFRQPAPTVKLASIRLLPVSSQEPVRSRRWQDLPLMALRLLLWTILALTLARPSCPVDANIEIYQAPQAAFIVLQADARSHHLIVQESLWQHTIKRAHTLIEALPAGSSVHLLALEPSFTHLDAGTDKSQAKAMLRSWEGKDPSAPFARQSQLELSAIFPALSTQVNQGPQALPKVAYFIGEPRREQNPCPSQGTAGLDEWICLSSYDIQDLPAPAKQLAITDLQVQTGQIQNEPTLELVATIQNYGAQQQLVQALKLEWYIDDQLRQTQSAQLQGGKATASWFFGVKDDAPHRVRVQIAQRDSFILDNRQERWIAERAPIRALLVDGDPSEQRAHDEIYLLAKALEQAFPNQGIEVRGTDPSQFEALLNSASTEHPDYDIVVLANASVLSDEQSQVLERWVSQGLGLWITAGSRINAEAYNKRLDALLPLRLRSTSAAEQGALAMSAPDSRHPMFSALLDPKALEGGQTQRVFLLEPDPKRNASVALRFTNGAPALVTKTVNQGRVAWWSTSIDRAWTDFTLHPGFVPLSRAIVSWLAREDKSLDQSSQTPSYVGQGIKLSSSQRIKVQGPKQMRWVAPETAFVPQRIGLYQGTGTRAKQTHRFAAILDPSASPPPRGAKHAQRPPAKATHAGVRSYLPIWPYLWPLAALALVVETLLRMLRLSR